MRADARVAVVGAGMSGLICAKRLADAGFDVTVFEKSRGLGGRLATRRTDHGPIDHGVRFLQPQNAPFGSFLDAACEVGDAALWPAEGRDGQHCYVGLPTMNGFVKPLTAGIEIERDTRVTGVSAVGSRWRLDFSDNRDTASFDRVILAVPAPQALELVQHVPELAKQISDVRIAPSWAYLAIFDRRLEDIPDVPAAVGQSIDWIARDNAKPGRTGVTDRWILHASADWSRTFLELDFKETGRKLRALFAGAIGISPPSPVYEAAHLWRFALTERPLGQPFLHHPSWTLAVCGDWCIGSSVEDAFRSGTALAEAILEADVTAC